MPGNSRLELLVAGAMLGLLLLMALPNLLPVVRSSAERHAVDDLAFFIDDVRVVSRTHPTPLRFRPRSNLDQDQPVVKRLLLRHGAVRRARIEVLQPFAFDGGRLIAKDGFGRIALRDTSPIRFVDVTPTGYICTRKANATQLDDLDGPCPDVPRLPRSAGCSQSGTSLSPLLMFALWPCLWPRWRRRQPRHQGPRRPRAARGYLLIEAVIAMLMLALCVSLVYAYVGKRRVQVRQGHPVAHQLLQSELRHLPPRIALGARPLTTSHDGRWLLTAKRKETRQQRVLLQFAVVDKDGADQSSQAGASAEVWVHADRVADPAPSTGGTP